MRWASQAVWSAVFAPLDLALGDTLTELAEHPSEPLALAVAWVSRGVREGHVCVDLQACSGTPIVIEEAVVATAPEAGAWRELLEASGIVGDGGAATPLVLDARGRLYLYRYWEHEQVVAARLRGLAAATADGVTDAALAEALDDEFLAPVVAAQRSPSPTEAGAQAPAEDRQRAAAAHLAQHMLTVLIGGPGTGKTTTVVRALRVLQALALAAGRPPHEILMLAPTGKAAARMSESVSLAQARLYGDDPLRASIPQRASTLHRALGFRAGTSVGFRRGPHSPLEADVVVVDEASMVDVAMMRRLLEALAPETRVLFVGDAHQLASVEAGSVLADLGAASGSPVGAAVVELTHSHRYDARGGIGAVARALREGQSKRVLELLDDPTQPEVTLVDVPDSELPRALAPFVERFYGPLVGDSGAQDVLGALGRGRVLAVHRGGPRGVYQLNRSIESVLAARGLQPARDADYHARLVMLVSNDHRQGLYNGDVGVIWRSEARAVLEACFLGSDGQLRRLSPDRLPSHETAFAMSVHKSQGSEFDEVVCVLPEASSPLLSRELLYTGISRARSRVTLVGSRSAVRMGAERSVRRGSGLRELLER